MASLDKRDGEEAENSIYEASTEWAGERAGGVKSF